MTDEEELEKMREIHGAIVERLAAQGGYAVGRLNGTCSYMTDKGMRCAVGVLIDAPVGTSAEDGWCVVQYLFIKEGAWYGGVSGDGVEIARALSNAGVPATYGVKSLLVACQQIHDAGAPKTFTKGIPFSQALEEIRRLDVEAIWRRTRQ